MKETNAGAFEELQEEGLSVCRNAFGICQSIDGAGKQTFRRSSKTEGGIKNSICQKAAHEKWVLSRPGQVAYLKEKLTERKIRHW